MHTMTSAEQPVPSRSAKAELSGRRTAIPAEPVAIVGMACKFPGADDLAGFARLLDDGVHAVSDLNADRPHERFATLFRHGEPELPACRHLAFVDGIELFDAEFFRISPVEAQFLDPQQRMVLETAWHALEDAGLDPESLRGARAAVFGGVSHIDYRELVFEDTAPSGPAASLYAATGNALNTTIGRVSFALGFEGPALAVDTACSSSLVALHQAVIALERGEADLALVAGVHAVFSGRLTEWRGRAGMLSPDGVIKAFDASANGYVRGEGCGIVVLKRLVDAEDDGNRIWALVRGSAVNQDGTTPGLTVPSGESQQQVVETALARAGAGPLDVQYVEAHGTGTKVGDPIELRAAAAVYGRGRSQDNPFYIGSVKTNFGHLESAAGIAAVIKTALALQAGIIPRHLHFQNPNPAVAWDDLPIAVPTRTTPWPLVPKGAPAMAGINSFGWSGTNAHVVLASHGTAPEAGLSLIRTVRTSAGPARPVPTAAGTDSGSGPAVSRTRRILTLSGKSSQAVVALAGNYAALLEEREADGIGQQESAMEWLADVAWTTATGRTSFPFRAAPVFHNFPTLRKQLELLSEGDVQAARPRTVAFAFTGQASQWEGMGQHLYTTEPVFKAALDRCDAWMQANVPRDRSLLDVMFGKSGAEGRLDDPAWTQPAIFALEHALTLLWASLGVRPAFVVGHSLGEIAAATAAGALTWQDALGFAAARGELMSQLPETGAMSAIFAPRSEVEAAVADAGREFHGTALTVAAYNATHQVVSGSTAGVDAVERAFSARGVRVRRLGSSAGYHSALVDPILDRLEQKASTLRVRTLSLPFVSNVTGRLLQPSETLDQAYWRRQARGSVQFESCIQALADAGVDAVVEVGPHAVLGPMIALTWPEGAPDGAAEGSGPPAVIASLRRPGRDTDPAEQFALATASAYCAGLPVDLRSLFGAEHRRLVAVPGYPFQRRRYWIGREARSAVQAPRHILGSRRETAAGEVSFETDLEPTGPTWLADHTVFGRVVVPGAIFAAAAALSLSDGPRSVLDMQFRNALVVSEPEGDDPPVRGPAMFQVAVLGGSNAAERRVEVHSRTVDAWSLHATARLVPARSVPQAPDRVVPGALAASLQRQDVDSYYRAKTRVGIVLGPSFRKLKNLWAADGQAVGEIENPQFPQSSSDDDVAMHPFLLDGCFQVFSAARASHGAALETAYMPFGFEALHIYAPWPDRVFCRARIRASDYHGEVPETVTGDFQVYAPDGTAVGEVLGYAVKRAGSRALAVPVAGSEHLFHEVVWRESGLAGREPAAGTLAPPDGVAARIPPFTRYLDDEGIASESRAAVLGDLEWLSAGYMLKALEDLGWRRVPGSVVDTDELHRRLGVHDRHRRLFAHMLLKLSASGILEPLGMDRWRVGNGPLAQSAPAPLRDPDRFAASMEQQYPHARNELGLVHRCGSALAAVLCNRQEPLELLFGEEQPRASDLYRLAPAARAANRMLEDAVGQLVASIGSDTRLCILEVGAGTGASTAAVLPSLPADRCEYVFTDISAGFFAAAERRFADLNVPITYRVLDIEQDPVAQGFELEAYDAVIAANVLHATRSLDETLHHCRRLLAPSGILVALEYTKGRGWQDITFGLLDGFWRFRDSYRSDHAMASQATWHTALADAGFGEVSILGPDGPDDEEPLGSSVILARAPGVELVQTGTWILNGAQDPLARELSARLMQRGDRVLTIRHDATAAGPVSLPVAADLALNTSARDAWRELFEVLPSSEPRLGVVHLRALTEGQPDATTTELAHAIADGTGSALALLQGMADTGVQPQQGVWLVTRGAQALDIDRSGALTGSVLWGMGKALVREAPDVGLRMIDFESDDPIPADLLVREMLDPDGENHIAYRGRRRHVARLVPVVKGPSRLRLADATMPWILERASDGAFESIAPAPYPQPALAHGEVRVEVDAAGLNFADVLLAMRGVNFKERLGGEFCGRIVEVGPETTGWAEGTRVIGYATGTFGPTVVAPAALLAELPDQLPTIGMAGVPIVHATARLAFRGAALGPGSRVLIHAAAGGVGTAAVQLARAAGAQVFATCSAPKRAHVHAMGVEHVYNSRDSHFAEQVMSDTGRAGVDLVLNCLTGPGFIEASLSCLARGGHFVEISMRDTWSRDEMARVRPDVAYTMLDIHRLTDEVVPDLGDVLRAAVADMGAGVLDVPEHCVWDLADAPYAMEYMKSARHVGKIVLAMPPVREGRLREDRTYLVTGGLGGIGRATAQWLADKGARAIVLNGRRPPGPEAEADVAALRARGVDVRIELADVAEPAAVASMLNRVDNSMPTLGGVIHSVGTLADGSLQNQDWGTFETVLWPKILGGWNLHRATEQRDLHLFILFSSSVGVLGRAGQSNHAAANAFLERLAAHRRASGLPAQVIHWGAWSEIGEAEEQRERIATHLMTTGVRWMTPRQGIAALDRVVAEGRASTVVTAVDWATYTDRLEGEQPFFADMVPSRKPELTVPQVQESPADVLRHLQTGESQGRQPTLVGFLQQELQALLRLPVAPDPEAAFADLGVDSLMAVEFRNRINRAFGDRYQASSTIVFDHPDVRTMARFLAQELGGEAVSVAEPVQKPFAAPKTTVPMPPADQDATVAVAVVGMACRFPDADGLEEFWTLLETGTSAVKECRPVADEGVPPGYATPFSGAFVRDLDRFDAAFFRTVPIEARTLDPQQRMLLEVGWHALEDAGVAPEALEGVTTGIYVGISNTEYRELMSAAGIPIDYPGTSGSFAAARLAQALRTQGPAVPIDMDCASALVAVDQAVRALHAGDVNLALAAGVNVVLSERATNSMAELQMLSPTGKCAPFAAAADGFVRGEGCGVLVLKRLADAEADGDRIWGVIRGSSVNQNTGRAGMMLPSEHILEQLLVDALDMAGWEPGDVDYLEAHAVGSTVGDAVEVQVAANVYGRGRLPSRPLLLGTVKHAIGHLETASGIAGLIKVMLAMQAGRIPSAGRAERLNTNVPWHRLPVRIAEETAQWPEQQGGMYRAAVNAFGVAGANAHVLVESPAENSRGVRGRVPAAHTGTFPDAAVRVPVWRMLPLSARSQFALQHVIEAHLDWLDESVSKSKAGPGSDEEWLADLAWTATVARSHHPWRCGVPFRDLVSLQDGLRSALSQPVTNPCRARQRIAMVFAADNSPWHQELDDLALMGTAAAAVIDRCAEILRQEFGGVLSDCDESGAGTWPATVMFAAYSAMVAQWAAVDIHPGVCLAGPGGVPSALHAAGALDLEGGMRLAASQDRGGPDASHAARAHLSDMTREPNPVFDLVAGTEMQIGRSQASDHNTVQSPSTSPAAACAALLVRESVDALVVFGLADDFTQVIQADWKLAAQKAGFGGTGHDGLAVVHTTLESRDALGNTVRGNFAASAAAAYAQGLSLSIHNLFDGESRRRIGIPLYPFAGRSYWLQRSTA